MGTDRVKKDVALTLDRFRITPKRLAIGHGMSVVAKAFSTEPLTIVWLGATVTSSCCSAESNNSI